MYVDRGGLTPLYHLSLGERLANQNFNNLKTWNFYLLNILLVSHHLTSNSTILESKVRETSALEQDQRRIEEGK